MIQHQGEPIPDIACTARIRPMAPANLLEIACEVTGSHAQHSGTLRDYARPGSTTIITWLRGDRRTFHGTWPGDCQQPGCFLPIYHHGNHAV